MNDPYVGNCDPHPIPSNDPELITVIDSAGDFIRIVIHSEYDLFNT
jgi:hypothetical protein